MPRRGTPKRPSKSEQKRGISNVGISLDAVPALQQLMDTFELPQYAIVSRVILWVADLPTDAQASILTKFTPKMKARLFRIVADELEKKPPLSIVEVPGDIPAKEPDPPSSHEN